MAGMLWLFLCGQIVAVNTVEAAWIYEEEVTETDTDETDETSEEESTQLKEKEEDAVKRVTEEYNANIKATFGEGVVPPAGGGTQTPDAKAAREAHNEYLRKRGLLPKEETTN